MGLPGLALAVKLSSRATTDCGVTRER